MATFLDAFNLIGETGFFEVFVPFFIVFGLMYGILTKSKILGEKVEWNAVIAFFIALLITSNVGYREFVNAIIPVFTLFALIIFLIVFLYLMLGAKEGDIAEALKAPIIQWTLIGFSIFIFFFVISNLYGGQLQAETLNETELNAWNLSSPNSIVLLLSHPAFLGVIIMMLMMAVVIYFTTKTS
ncbi:MAG: hypothetical protein GOU97_00965 [Nanoarchaeota archaeon]|nr:hypothetical protein [Nanoarchaeota archaeon]